jgi:hypothetical protein
VVPVEAGVDAAGAALEVAEQDGDPENLVRFDPLRSAGPDSTTWLMPTLRENRARYASNFGHTQPRRSGKPGSSISERI